jgi:hypothetical protein
MLGDPILIFTGKKSFGGGCHTFYLFCLFFQYMHFESHSYNDTVQYIHPSPFAEASLSTGIYQGESYPIISQVADDGGILLSYVWMR